MSFAKALAATITIASLVLTPVAASAQSSTYLGDDGKFHDLGDDNPRPKDGTHLHGQVWICPPKETDSSKRPLFGKSCDWAFPSAKAAEEYVAQHESINSIDSDGCDHMKPTCDLPVGRAPSLDNSGSGPIDPNYRKEDPNCGYANATSCRWINLRLAGTTVSDMQRTPSYSQQRPRSSSPSWGDLLKLGAVVAMIGGVEYLVYRGAGGSSYYYRYDNGNPHHYIPVPAVDLYGCHRPYPLRCQ